MWLFNRFYRNRATIVMVYLGSMAYLLELGFRVFWRVGLLPMMFISSDRSGLGCSR